MNRIKLQIGAFLVLATLATTSCSENKTSTKEEVEIKTMDSVSTQLEKTTKELDEQTEKVEASLEKLDKEFDSTN